MPTIGGVYVPDELMPRFEAPAQERPGFGAILGAAARNAFGQVRYGLPYQAAKLDGSLTPEDEAFYQRGLAETAAAASRATPAGTDDLFSGRVNPVRFAAENLVASLPFMAGAAVGAVGGAVVGGPVGAVAGGIAGGVPQFSGSNVARAVEEQGSLSEEAAGRALLVAPVQSAADLAVARFLPGAGKLLGDVAATQSGGLIRRTAKSVIKAGATEAVTEAGQQVAERYAAGIPVSGADAAAEYVNAAVTAFAVGGLLGAGGGFRRTNAVAKPADMVTAEDMNQHIDKVLSGELRALPAPSAFGRSDQEQATALPAPGPVWAGFQKATEVPGTRQDGARPYQGISDAELDAALGAISRAHDNGAVTDELARVAPMLIQEAEIREAGRRSVETPDQLALPAPASAPQVTTVDTLVTPPVMVGDTQDVWSPSAVNADQLPRELTFDEQLSVAKKGLRGGFVQSIQAASQEELLDKVYNQIFVEQDTRVNTRKFAQRLGILDADMNPGPESKKVEARRSETTGQTGGTVSNLRSRAGGMVTATEIPAPPPATALASVTGAGVNDESFESQWLGILNSAGIQRLRTKDIIQTPRDLPSAQAQIFRALATDSSNAAVSQTEKIARKMGLVTDDDSMDVTPLGRKTFLTTPEGLEATVSAAQQQGFTGAQASLFDRGVKGEPVDSFTSFADMAAYEAGKVWAQDFTQNGDVRTARQTKAIQERQSARVTGEAVDRKSEAVRVQLTPQQVQQAALNRLIDTVDLKGVQDTERASLWRMVRDGATSEEVGQAIQKVQQGGTVFEQPAAAAPAPFVGARADSAARRRRLQAQQAVAERERRTSGSKADQRAETRALLRGEIDAAFQSGDLSTKERIGLVARLVKGDYVGVVNHLPGGPLRKEMNVSTRGLLDDVATSAAGTLTDAEAKTDQVSRTELTKQLQVYVKAGNILAALKHLSEHSPDAGYRLVANKLLANGAWDRVSMVVGEEHPKLQGAAILSPDGSSRVELYGGRGLSQETILHELIHAYVMQRWAGLEFHVERRARWMENDPGTVAVRSFADLWGKVGQALKANGLADSEVWAHNFSQDPDEALSWMLTNKKAQAYLKSVDENGDKLSSGSPSLWDRFMQWISGLLGIKSTGKARSALDQLLDAGHAIIDAGKDVRVAEIGASPLADMLEGSFRKEMRVSAENRTVGAANEVTQALASALDKLDISPADIGVKARRKVLGWLSNNQLDRQYARQMPGMLRRSDAYREREAVRGRFSQMGDEAYQSFEKLERENKNAAEWVGQLMALTTEFQLDPDKAWSEHTHLQGDKNEANLKRLHGDAVKLANDLKRGDGQGMKVFTQFRALNEAQNYARMAAGLHSLVATDPELSLGIEDSEVNPVDQFMREEGLTTAQAVRDRWSDLLHKQVASAVAFVNQKKGEAALGTESDQRAMAQHLSPIELQVSAIHEALGHMAKAPYFHLGRFGDHFGSAVIRKTEDGIVDPAAQQHVAEALDKAGFGDVQVSTDNTKPRFMLRFDTVDQTLRFRQLALDLQKQGWLAADEIKAGPRSREGNFGVAEGMPGYVQRYIQALEASPMFSPDEGMTSQEKAALEQSKNDAVRLAIDTWLEQQPDSSISKVLVKRYTVPGYKKDMIRNFAHRWRVGSISLANVASQPKFNRAYADMRAQVNEALVAKDDAAGDPFLLNDLLGEMKTRDAANPVNETADTFDRARAYAHGYFLGMSPAYGIINLTQLGVTALPELAKTHGYVKSFHAMRRASAQALAVLSAARKEAAALGPKHYADVAITESVLKKAGLSDDVRNFALHMLATGTIDIGSAARALGQIAENRVGSKTDIALKYASAVGLYTETFSRLTTALAARELNGGSSAEAASYATKVVSNSMFDYQNWNTARQLGKRGVLGPVTPIVAQFMSYSVQITEKLYSEVMDAASRQRPGESAESARQRRAEARTFLFGHLTAVTALAGTLGMPFATVFATVIERLVDAFDDDDEPYDATAAWRGFLADVFGQDVAEVVARGVPRAAGFDISQRAGEQSLLPFSEFLADRRPWKEAIENNVGRSLGAVPSMFSNIITGGGKFADGDVLGGMKDIMPVAFKGPVEVYRMTEKGYLDSKGNKMPMSPDASSYLWQLIGFSPAEKAEYSEARGDQMARRGELSREATRRRQQIVRAMLTGDQDQARELISAAMDFDRDNPAFAVVPSLAGSLQRQVQAQARARALNSPLGVPLEDIAGQNLTRYANVGYAR